MESLSSPYPCSPSSPRPTTAPTTVPRRPELLQKEGSLRNGAFPEFRSWLLQRPWARDNLCEGALIALCKVVITLSHRLARRIHWGDGSAWCPINARGIQLFYSLFFNLYWTRGYFRGRTVHSLMSECLVCRTHGLC